MVWACKEKTGRLCRERVDQMERKQTIRDRGRPKKTIREIIKKDLELNDLNRSIVLDRIL